MLKKYKLRKNTDRIRYGLVYEMEENSEKIEEQVEFQNDSSLINKIGEIDSNTKKEIEEKKKIEEYEEYKERCIKNINDIKKEIENTKLKDEEKEFNNMKICTYDFFINMAKDTVDIFNTDKKENGKGLLEFDKSIREAHIKKLEYKNADRIRYGLVYEMEENSEKSEEQVEFQNGFFIN